MTETKKGAAALLAFAVVMAVAIYFTERPASKSDPSRPDPAPAMVDAMKALNDAGFVAGNVAAIRGREGSLGSILTMDNSHVYAVLIYCEREPCDGTVELMLRHEQRQFSVAQWSDLNVVSYLIPPADLAQLRYRSWNRGSVAYQWWSRHA